jgi:hypothetical protein
MNRLHIFILFLILGFNVLIVEAQDGPKKNWKKLVKDAEEYEKLGDIFRSAQNYEEAFSLKKDKKELSYKAGKNYMESRHYAKAVKCLEPVQNDNNVSAFNKPGFTYASALKQSGQFAEARIAFESFISTYDGSDKEKMREMAENEILGCTYALRGSEITNQDISVQLLDFNVNTDRTEFAPIPFTDNVLYFSSTVSGVSKIYRTQKNRQGTWMTRQVPTIFTGKMVKPHFGNGSFTPDGKRFFFTQCDLIVGAKPMCEIYLMYEEKGNWSEPIRLPDEINLKGVNTTHPQVVIIEGKEVLYFASDREGGVGGMDIWYSSRNLTDGGTDFTIPKNLGQNVNTPGEEVSPHYNYPNKTLFFSSNGKVSTGGYDVYKSVGEKMEWAEAVNIGFPLNSSADDLFFVVSESHGGGYLISNRLSGKEKQSTINDDIFYYAEIKRQLLVKGAVYSEKDPTKTPLKDVSVKFYEWDGSNKKIAHELNMPLANEYKVILAPEKEFKMEVICQGYQLYTTDISTKGVKTTETRIKDIALKMAEEEPVVMVPANTSKDNPFVVPLTVPNDPKTGKPYAEGTAGYKAFLEADKIAKEADDRKVYWENGVLKAYKEPKVEPRFVIVPEEYNGKDKPYTLPKTVPNDPKTGKPYAANTDVYKAFTEANKVALQADERKVYWENGKLTPFKAPEIDPRFVIVPEKYNSKDNPYTLPTKIPTDPKTAKPYAAGSAVVKAYVQADSVAKKADARKVYWDNGKLTAIEKVIAAVDSQNIVPEPDYRFVITPKEYNSKENTFVLPKTVPIDPKTGKPYVPGTKGYEEFMKADKIAKTADGRKVYWDGETLKAYKEPEPDYRYVVTPKEYNSKENTFVLPKTVPIDPKTGKPYAPGTKGYEEFMKADKIAKTADGRKVYWDGETLKAYKEPEPDPRYVIVPAKHNSSDNPYKLPKVVPNDPKTGKPFLVGTPVYKAFEAAAAVAKNSPERKVYWEGEQLIAFVPIDTTPAIALTGQSFKVQVAAMKSLNPAKYQELSAGDLSEYIVNYEKIQDGITRVVVVPKAKNEDGTYGFKNKEDALRALKSVIDLTNFKTSFVGIYEGDKRLDGLIRLDNQPKK